MPVEILTAGQRAEWERFPFFSFGDDDGLVPVALEELPEPAVALIASQLDTVPSSIQPARLNTERDARAEHIAEPVKISAFELLAVGAGAAAAPVKQLAQQTRSVG